MTNAFVRGFLKQANLSGVNSDDALSTLKSIFGITDTSESLFDAAGHGSNSGEFLGISKHIGSHGLAPAAIGGGVGAGIGALTGAKGKKKDDAVKGGLIGGGLGFLAGAGNDAYRLGANSRSEMSGLMNTNLDSLLEEKRENATRFPWNRQDPLIYEQAEQSLKHNKGQVDNSKWYEFYYPPKVIGKFQ